MKRIPDIGYRAVHAIDIDLPEVANAWNRADILVFLVDMDRYAPGPDHLTITERETIKSLKSDHFRKRFVLSRTLLKLLLREILGDPTDSYVSLSPYTMTRVRVNDGDYPWISLSYSQNFMALFLSKYRAAGDIEMIRPCTIPISKYRAFHGLKQEACVEDPAVFWERWTRVEAATKVQDIPLLEGLCRLPCPSDLFFRSFVVDNRLMCSIGSIQDHSRVGMMSWAGAIPGREGDR